MMFPVAPVSKRSHLFHEIISDSHININQPSSQKNLTVSSPLIPYPHYDIGLYRYTYIPYSQTSNNNFNTTPLEFISSNSCLCWVEHQNMSDNWCICSSYLLLSPVNQWPSFWEIHSINWGFSLEKYCSH